MQVFFTASGYLKGKHQPVYNLITSHLTGRGFSVLSLETQNYEDLLDSKSNQLTHNKKHYKYILRAVEKADLGVLEVSNDSFRLGHEATLLLLFNKPVLCLASNRDFSKNIYHPLFHAYRYNDTAEIPGMIDKFIDRYKDKLLSVRFNGFITPEQKCFLQKRKKSSGMSYSEIIRTFINEAMGK